MGIKHLNKFLKENCANSIQQIRLDKLHGKTIVIDTSIYLYKFVSEDALIENIYLLLSIFRTYHINPVFVFDGKPPDDKLDLLRKRKHEKIMAEQEYESLKRVTEQMDATRSQKMMALKKQFVYITKQQIADVKTMIRASNMVYIDAPGESDEICAQMVLNGQAYAVMSEDMDMFVYGCPVVLRYTSLLNHTTVTYDVKGILSELGITQHELREICVLSGTDYSQEGDLHQSLKLFKQYHKQSNQIGFYKWLQLNGYLTDTEVVEANRIRERFEFISRDIVHMTHENTASCMDIIPLLKEQGFLFPVAIKTLKTF